MSTVSLETGPMTDEVLNAIFASDQDMYPAPLTWERLRSWTTAAPEMAKCFYLPAEGSSGTDARTTVGAVIVLPLLAPAWRDLLAGKIKETDVEAGSMFPREGEAGAEVGLHVFHVERFDVAAARGRVRGFADISMRAVVAAAGDKRWRIVGHSALTATSEGRRCFEKMGFEPTGYEELWVADERGGVRPVTVSADTPREERRVLEDAPVRGHARMFGKHLDPASGA